MDQNQKSKISTFVIAILSLVFKHIFIISCGGFKLACLMPNILNKLLPLLHLLNKLLPLTAYHITANYSRNDWLNTFKRTSNFVQRL